MFIFPPKSLMVLARCEVSLLLQTQQGYTIGSLGEDATSLGAVTEAWK